MLLLLDGVLICEPNAVKSCLAKSRLPMWPVPPEMAFASAEMSAPLCGMIICRHPFAPQCWLPHATYSHAEIVVPAEPAAFA